MSEQEMPPQQLLTDSDLLIYPIKEQLSRYFADFVEALKVGSSDRGYEAMEALGGLQLTLLAEISAIIEIERGLISHLPEHPVRSDLQKIVDLSDRVFRGGAVSVMGEEDISVVKMPHFRSRKDGEVVN